MRVGTPEVGAVDYFPKLLDVTEFSAPVVVPPASRFQNCKMLPVTTSHEIRARRAKQMVRNGQTWPKNYSLPHGVNT